MFLTWTMPLGSLSIMPLDIGVQQNLANSWVIYFLGSVSEDHLGLAYLADSKFLEWICCNRMSSHLTSTI